jgi:protein gp37
MGKSSIEWCERTLNLFTGCDIISAGCTNCYAMRMAHRIEAMGQHRQYFGTTKVVNGNPVWTGKLQLAPESRWKEPLQRQPPTIFFVNSMSDFWHPAAEDAWIRRALMIFELTPRHQYQVLTKRPENINPRLERLGCGMRLPPNFWAGVSVENARVVERIDELRQVQADIRFLSVEPLIGPLGRVDLSGIHWVIVGAESGPGARPMSWQWVREVRDQCVNQGVAFFLKQSATAAGHKISLPYLDGRRWTEMPAGFALPALAKE